MMQSKNWDLHWHEQALRLMHVTLLGWMYKRDGPP
jgi:hypothetical protein